jgi:hypothetical protein
MIGCRNDDRIDILAVEQPAIVVKGFDLDTFGLQHGLCGGQVLLIDIANCGWRRLAQKSIQIISALTSHSNVPGGNAVISTEYRLGNKIRCRSNGRCGLQKATAGRTSHGVLPGN